MKLLKYYNKKVKILCENDLVFEGWVNDYIYPEDNENEKESIIIDTIDGKIIEFYEKDILTIEICN